MENTNNTDWFLDEDEEFIFPSKLSNEFAAANMKISDNDLQIFQDSEPGQQHKVQYWKVESWKV